MLWAFCPAHTGGYYFFDVRVQRFKPNEVKLWANDSDIRKVSALCMECGDMQLLYVHVSELEEHRYPILDLCQCGLPYYHKNPPREFIRQYNAVPVVCRPSQNGQHPNV